MLQSRINLDWLTFDPQMFAALFPRLKEGILRDVFIQKAIVAWDNGLSNRIMVSLPLRGPIEADQWLQDVRTSRNMWPLQKTSHVMANQLATEIFMRRERRRLQARHIWEKIEPNWPMIEERVRTKQATGLPYEALYRRLFLQEFAEESRWLRILTRGRIHTGSNSRNVAGHGLERKPQRSLRVKRASTLHLHRLDQIDVLSWQWIDHHENPAEQARDTQQGASRRKRPPDVRDDPMRGQ